MEKPRLNNLFPRVYIVGILILLNFKKLHQLHLYELYILVYNFCFLNL